MHATERDTPRVRDARRLFVRRLARVATGRLVFFDEFGTNLAMTPTYARAPRGQRAAGHAPQRPGPNVTLTFALTARGARAPWMHAGAADGRSVTTYVRTQLAPTLHAGDVVVCDNLGAHKVDAVRDAVRARGAQLVLLPPYSPDLNPIEMAGSKVKRALRKAAPRSRRALVRATGAALDTITADDACGFFRHSGYRLKRR